MTAFIIILSMNIFAFIFGIWSAKRKLKQQLDKYDEYTYEIIWFNILKRNDNVITGF